MGSGKGNVLDSQTMNNHHSSSTVPGKIHDAGVV